MEKLIIEVEIMENEKLREELQLSCNFTCYDKNNMSGSSEGYYLYLFPSLLDTLEDDMYEEVIVDCMGNPIKE